MNHYKFLLFCLWVTIFFSCKKKKDPINSYISDVNIDISIERFDQKFKNLNQKSLDTLKKNFPFFFPAKYTDEFWVKKSNDTLLKEIRTEIKKVYPNSDKLSKELTLLYKHLRFYYPNIKKPRILTVISELDYKNNIILTKELLIISLECYLGENHHFYESISKFISDDFKEDLISVDIAYKYAQKIVPRPTNRDFLSHMILHGKRNYLVSKLLPKKSIAQIFHYKKSEWKWNEENETEMWRYFLDKDLLYSTDKNLLPRFLYPAPFSKFYMSYDSESPDRVGEYIGYRIVEDFMKNNDVSLQQLMEIEEKTIFQKSRYKPKK